jgi:hypothetical protein
VTESELDPAVLHAFHLQYPNAGDFVDFVRSHSGDSEAVAGVVNGIKGKLFEVEYLNYLNDGHLEPGTVAELAADPTQPGWHIVVRNESGQMLEHLQLKATNNLTYIKQALANHPEIDVVGTHEVFQHFNDPELQAHLIDSGIDNTHLSQLVEKNVQDHLGHGFEIPLLALGIIAYQSWRRYRKGGAPLQKVMQQAFRRGTYSVACRGASYLATALASEPTVGMAASVILRLGLGRYDTQKQFLQFVDDCRVAQRERLQFVLVP